MTGDHDPRTEAEKARAALARNSEMGGAVPESDLERRPSVTPETFGEHGRPAQNQAGRDGVVAGGPSPDETRSQPGDGGRDNSPGQGGYGHADSRMGRRSSEALAEAEKVITGRDGEGASDAMSRAKDPHRR